MFETDSDQIQSSFGVLYMSVVYYAIRELWFSVRSRGWNVVQGTIESGARTKGGSRSWVQLEIWYSYSYDRKAFSGSVRRDCLFGSTAERALGRYERGKTVAVLVDPEVPCKSYLPSGLGWIEPAIAALPTGMILGILFLILASPIR